MWNLFCSYKPLLVLTHRGRLFLLLKIIYFCANVYKDVEVRRVIVILKDIYFYFDDSGVLHKNERSKCFVYAGYVFKGREERDNARRLYRKANKDIRDSTGTESELKASVLGPAHKRSLYNALREFESLSAVVDISRVYDNILSDKRAICRYKDFVMKMAIKAKLQDYLQRGVLSRYDDIRLHISVDEQLTSTNGYYSLRDSIYEELRHGIANFNYGVEYPRLFQGEVEVAIQYLDSKKNYLIQASDIIANRIWTSYAANRPNLRIIPNHIGLTFP